MSNNRKTYAGRWLQDGFNIFVNELKLIFHDSGVLLIFGFAGLVYPLLYNFIYRDGVVDEMPVAVVDLSQGSYSRRYVREFDATRECAVAYDCVSMAEAEKLMADQKIHGILYFPSDFDERLARMEQATVSTFADMSTFLYYKNMTMASNLVMLDEIHSIQAEHYAAAGYTGQDAAALIEPVGYDAELLFNRPISFTMFFVYMAMMLILQQVMFYGSSMLAGTLREEHRSFARLTADLSGHGMGRVVLGRGAAYFVIFLCLGMYGTLLIPGLFHLPMHCSWTDILVLLLFFVTDIIFFSFTWSSLITRRETVLVLLLAVTPIAALLTGFTWPTANFPGFWKAVSYIFPTTFGVRAYMNLCNAGTLSAIAPEIIGMTVQIIVYYILASMAVYIEGKVIERKEMKKEAAL